MQSAEWVALRKFKDLRSHVKSKAAAEHHHATGTSELISFAYHTLVSIVANLAWCG